MNGTGLAVFNSPYLYAGQPLDGNSYFKFHDLYDTNTAHRDNPANTYATNEAREYLTEAYLNTLSQANVNYSYLDGPANAPVYHGGAFYLNTLVRVTPNVFNPPLTIGFVQTGPGCYYCLGYYSNNYIHSTAVFASKPNGYPAAITTEDVPDPSKQNNMQEVTSALNLITGKTAALADAYFYYPGSGPMASGIAPPAVMPADNSALIANTFGMDHEYPSAAWRTWDIDFNGSFNNCCQAGQVMPSGPVLSRWVDYAVAIAPLPNSSSVFMGAPFTSTVSGQRAIEWGTVQVSPIK